MIVKALSDIFIPARLGTYQLISQRIVGIVLSKTKVYATKILLQGNKVTIERTLVEPISNDAVTTQQERIAAALKNIMASIGKYDQIRTSLSASVAVFKELTMPFSDMRKIAMVLPFELEPFLPFPLSEAIVDFVITKQDQHGSTIVAAAVKKEYIAEYLAYFTQAGLQPAAVTLDVFDIYGLYTLIPEYSSLPRVACIDIGLTTTTILYIVNHQLGLIRTLAQGISSWAKILAQKLNIPPAEVVTKIVRFGVTQAQQPDAYQQAMQEIMTSFFQEIRFTLDSFSVQKPSQEPLSKILLTGEGAQLIDIGPFAQDVLHTPVQLLSVHSLITNGMVKLKQATVQSDLPSDMISSFAAAYITPRTQDFTLKRGEFATVHTKTFLKQLITTVLLCMLPLVLLLGKSIWDVRALGSKLKQAEQEVLTTLRKLDLSQAKNMNSALREAEEKVIEEETIWFAFSRQTRLSFLQYLQKLSTHIDKKSLGLKIAKMSITKQEPSKLVIEGQVKDFDAVKVLERELKQTGLFTHVPSLQTTKFSLEMEFKKNGEETP